MHVLKWLKYILAYMQKHPFKIQPTENQLEMFGWCFHYSNQTPDANNVEEERVTLIHFSEMLDMVVWPQALGKTSR